MKTTKLFVFTSIVVLCLIAPLVGAERIPRLSYVGGDVAVQAQGDDGWESADANMPLGEGDVLSAEKDGLVEVQVDDGSFIRVNRSSEVRFEQLRNDRVVLNMRFGDIIVHVRSSVDYLVQTPQGTVRLRQEGVYRVTAENANIVEIQTRSGSARFENDQISRKVSSGRRLVVTDGNDEVMGYLNRDDDFDAWSDERDSRYASTYQSNRYIPASVSYGVYDLDYYGSWVSAGDYGWCWRPRSVWDGWAPYRYGYWRNCGAWGYTWVSYDPWGWLPYHYGRWTYTTSWGWIWLPGSSWGIDVWCPGAVRFSMCGGNIGWCPLGPGDYYWDYWRHGGGSYNNYNYYNACNLRYNNAVTYVSVDDFRRGRPIGAGVYNRNLLIGSSARGAQAVNFRTDSGTARQIFQRERIIAGAPRVDPLRTASFGRVNAGRSRDASVAGRDGSSSANYSRGASTRNEGRGSTPPNDAYRGIARSDESYGRSGGTPSRSDPAGSRGSSGSYDRSNRGRPGVEDASGGDSSRSRSYDGSSSSRSRSDTSSGSSRNDYSRGDASSRGSSGSSRGSSDTSRSSGSSSGSSRGDSSSQGSSGYSRGSSEGSRSSGSSSGSSSSSSSSGAQSSGSSSRPGRGDSEVISYSRERTSNPDDDSSHSSRSGRASYASGSSSSSRGASGYSQPASRASSRAYDSDASYTRPPSYSASSSGSSRSSYASGSSSRTYTPPPSSSGSSSRAYSAPPSSSGSSSRAYSGPPPSSGSSSRSYSAPPPSSGTSGRSYSAPPPSSGSSSSRSSTPSSSSSSGSSRAPESSSSGSGRHR